MSNVNYGAAGSTNASACNPCSAGSNTDTPGDVLDQNLFFCMSLCTAPIAWIRNIYLVSINSVDYISLHRPVTRIFRCPSPLSRGRRLCVHALQPQILLHTHTSFVDKLKRGRQSASQKWSCDKDLSLPLLSLAAGASACTLCSPGSYSNRESNSSGARVQRTKTGFCVPKQWSISIEASR
jgi:hypothetical protein